MITFVYLIAVLLYYAILGMLWLGTAWCFIGAISTLVHGARVAPKEQ